MNKNNRSGIAARTAMLITLASAAAFLCAATPISSLKFTSDANANGNSLTNAATISATNGYFNNIAATNGITGPLATTNLVGAVTNTVSAPSVTSALFTGNASALTNFPSASAMGLGTLSTSNSITTSNITGLGSGVPGMLAAAVSGTGSIVGSSNSMLTVNLLSQVIEDAAITSGTGPSAMTWIKVGKQTLCQPINPNLITTSWNFALPPPGISGGTIVNGTWQTAVGIGNPTIQLNDSPKIPYFGVLMHVVQMAGNSNGDQVFVGLINPNASASPHYGFIYDNVTETVTGYAEYGSNNYFFGSSGSAIDAPGDTGAAPINLSAGNFDIACVLADRSFFCMVRPYGKAWVTVAVFDATTGGNADFRTPSVLAGYQPDFYTYNPAGSGNPIIISKVQAGYTEGFNATNLSEIHFEDGTPLIQGGNQYMVGNIVGASANSSYDVTTACCGIFRWNESTLKLDCVGLINTLRNSSGNKLFGENSGDILYDRTAGKFRCFIPNWGDGIGGTVRIYEYDTTENVLSGVHILSGGALVTLPYINSADYVYDPSVRLKSGVWQIAYADNNTSDGICPGLAMATASGTTAPSSLSFSQIWQDTSGGYGEGEKIRTIDGTDYVLSANEGGSFNVLNFSSGSLVTTWSLSDYSATVPAPHLNLVYVERNGITQYYIVTFDDQTYPALRLSANNNWYASNFQSTTNQQAFSEGNPTIYLSNQTTTGDELPVVKAFMPDTPIFATGSQDNQRY